MRTINLSQVCKNNPFSFDNDYPKETPTGMRYKTYRGLRMYLITGCKNPKWLQAVTPSDFETLRAANEPYVYVSDLTQQLVQALELTLAPRPLINLIADSRTQVIWSGTDCSSAEQHWLEVVKLVVAKL